MIEFIYGSVSRGLGVLAGVYMSDVDVCVGLLEMIVNCILNKIDHNMSSMLTLCFCCFCFGLLRLLADETNSKLKTKHKDTLYMAI